MICPWSAGGGTDRVSRQIASQLERELGVPVNVINATGGGGVTGHTRGALARPNGYNMTMVTAEINMLHWRGLTNITFQDYRPLMKVNRDNAALFVRADAPWESLEELEAAIAENPGKLQASGTAFGGVWHVSLAGWLLEAGLPADAVTWISINGSAPSLQELTAGGVDMVSCSFPEARSLYEAGEIRSLGVMAEERLEDHPEIPTFKEQGYDWSNQTWRGLAVPNGVPDERYNRLLDAVNEVVHSEEYRNFLETSGFGGGVEPPKEFLSSLKEENQKYGEIFNSAAFESVVSQRYGPMLFPYILMGLMGLALLGIVVSGNLQQAESAEKITAVDFRRTAWVLGSIILYLLIAEYLGFILSAALILGLLMWQFRVNWKTALLVILITVPLIYQLFAVYLRVPLPWGLLGW
ncbi:tripartite tricarboxylate transporter substrate-binding protein [Aliifodinibius sp. S!AR15-10]|uniref:tripartite tricarboxylate transporter substrate-binding protein n=1 Tax=Aliifodinibius sp. S!AR15-10 TaxID=2950437 RepID=UPI002864886B|nr:tripartite tricarboxylate transporter substrate-binding protein [Aliifodinibius sp. S!AR15-10]MDR8391053.1 tripartite tricarboxylate transporter substrate-binding protein [Aliifodinibius sp. S!AR15-10]